MKYYVFETEKNWLNQMSFNEFCVPKVKEIIEKDPEAEFMLEDDDLGVFMQNYLRVMLKDHSHVTIYHVGNYPIEQIVSLNFKRKGDYPDQYSVLKAILTRTDVLVHVGKEKRVD